jgi:hypothetical protein
MYRIFLYLPKLKLVALLQTAEFRSEIPRSQNRNIQDTNTLGNITNHDNS